MLGPEDPLTRRPRRILVAGTSGSGKSTLARAIGAQLGIPYTEIDALHHGPSRRRGPPSSPRSRHSPGNPPG